MGRLHRINVSSIGTTHRAMVASAQYVVGITRCDDSESCYMEPQCGFSQVHYFTQDDFAIEANRSKSWPTGKQDPPLMFNIRQDPSETHTVHHSSNEYKKHIAIINAAKVEHLATIVPVCSQDKAPCGGNNRSYAVCGDQNSQAKYPQWPACTTTPANWEKKLCPS